MDMSGEEFLAAMGEGTFDDVGPDDHSGLLDVLMALPSYADASRPELSPYHAVEAFLVPLERAVARRGAGESVVSPGGRATTAETHLWRLDGGDGLVLRGHAAGCRFLASVNHRIISAGPPMPNSGEVTDRILA